jgi:large subunit ribosomal protein L5
VSERSERTISTETATEERPVPRLKVRYNESLRADLQHQLGLGNIMQAPRLEKIVVNMGVGAATAQASLLEGAQRDLTVITGQKPLVTRARKSIAGFKLREGNAIGAKVTLRGDRMWEFLDRLISIAIPRIRDFRGLNPRSFDGHGNYTFGLTEQLVFPEIDYDSVDQPRGMDITIVTTATTDAEGRALLLAMGFPFRRDGQ